jgi:hypothetical protein
LHKLDAWHRILGGSAAFCRVQRFFRLIGLSVSIYEEEGNLSVLGKPAKSSQRTFAKQFQWWEMYCNIRDMIPIWHPNRTRSSLRNLGIGFHRSFRVSFK